MVPEYPVAGRRRSAPPQRRGHFPRPPPDFLSHLLPWLSFLPSVWPRSSPALGPGTRTEHRSARASRPRRHAPLHRLGAGLPTPPTRRPQVSPPPRTTAGHTR